jgi:uncharacterized protein YhaN
MTTKMTKAQLAARVDELENQLRAVTAKKETYKKKLISAHQYIERTRAAVSTYIESVEAEQKKQKTIEDITLEVQNRIRYESIMGRL